MLGGDRPRLRPARLHAFTRRLDLDTAAAMPYHNGRTEGVNTKTKLIKRQMYGRGFTSSATHPARLNHPSSPPKVRQSR